jgi:hypothetical protein
MVLLPFCREIPFVQQQCERDRGRGHLQGISQLLYQTPLASSGLMDRLSWRSCCRSLVSDRWPVG